MGAAVRYLQRHSATGQLSFLRVYPPALRPFIDGSPKELKVSLGPKASSRTILPFGTKRLRSCTLGPLRKPNELGVVNVMTRCRLHYRCRWSDQLPSNCQHAHRPPGESFVVIAECLLKAPRLNIG